MRFVRAKAAGVSHALLLDVDVNVGVLTDRVSIPDATIGSVRPPRGTRDATCPSSRKAPCAEHRDAEKERRSMADAYIYDAVRTPRGKGKKDGSLHEITALSLATQVLE